MTTELVELLLFSIDAFVVADTPDRSLRDGRIVLLQRKLTSVVPMAEAGRIS